MNDDGTEATATWREDQDEQVTTVGIEENIRIRFLVWASAGNPDCTQYTLQYRKVGDTTWNDLAAD